MKFITTAICLFIFTTLTYSQDPYTRWEEEAKTNKRLLPRYGYLPKSESEIRADSAYIKEMMTLPQSTSRRVASNNLISLGFNYYYRGDYKTAMYRFNQAYLLDSTNTDIFWGYGAIYMAFNMYALSKEQYITGLAIDSTNSHLLTDLGTYFMGQYYQFSQLKGNEIVNEPQAIAKQYMDSAIYNLNKSYQYDPKDVNTVYKLSICYWNISDCSNAWKYYDEAVALGGKPITEVYTRDLKKRCKG